MRRVVAAPVVLLAAAAATGWLYVVRPALPGPRIGEALPLDELARHSSAPLTSYVLVWAVTGLVVGAVLRWARVERVTAALLLALGVGLWVYLTDGLSIAVVRQISARDALDIAARVHAVYLAAALAGLGGALLTEPRSRGGRGALVGHGGFTSRLSRPEEKARLGG